MKFNTLNLILSDIDAILRYKNGRSTNEYEKLKEFTKISVIGSGFDELKAAIRFTLIFIEKDGVVLEDFKNYSYDYTFKIGLIEYIKLISKHDSDYIKPSYSLCVLEDLNSNILSVARSIYKNNEIVNNLGLDVFH